MKPRTFIFFSAPTNESGQISDDTQRDIRETFREISEHLGDGIVRVLTSTHRLATATGGVIAQALCVGRIEKITCMNDNGTDQSASALEYLFSSALAEDTNSASTVIVVSGQINASRLAHQCGPKFFGQETTREISLAPCRARVVSKNTLLNAIFPQRRRRRTR